MNLDYLKTYLEVIRLGSFSQVARKLSLSQPAISFQIQKLERDLGICLIDRSQKTVTMTEAGKHLLRFAQFVTEERARLVHGLDELRQDIAGDLSLAASTIPGEFLLPPLLGEFRALHPAIGARLTISDSTAVINEVRQGNYQAGFCGIAPGERELDSFKVDEDEIVLIVFPEHPFAEREKVPFIELEGEPLIFREETSGTQKELEFLLSRAGLDIRKLSSNLILGTTQAVVSAVEAGVGIAFVSNLAIKKSLALGLVKVVPLNELRLRRDFFCVYQRGSAISRLVREFTAFVRARSPQTG